MFVYERVRWAGDSAARVIAMFVAIGTALEAAHVRECHTLVGVSISIRTYKGENSVNFTWKIQTLTLHCCSITVTSHSFSCEYCHILLHVTVAVF